MSESDQVTFNDDEEIEIEAVGVEVSEQPIELYKVLKLADAATRCVSILGCDHDSVICGRTIIDDT